MASGPSATFLNHTVMQERAMSEWGSLKDLINPPQERHEFIVPACGPAFGRFWLGSSADLLAAAKDAACIEQDFVLAAAIRDFINKHR
jgi:hypothetical protein